MLGSMPEKFDFLYAGWIFLNVGYFVVVILHFFQDFIPEFFHGLIRYGKTFSHKKITSFLDRLLYVPNSWFTHFYVVGVCCCLVLLSSLITKGDTPTWLTSIASLIPSKDTEKIQCASVLVGLLMLLVQVSRRLLECLFVSVFTGRIHLAHYVVASAFYVMDAVSIAAPHLSKLGNKDWYQTCVDVSNYLHWIHVLSVILFAWASIHQHRCHVILANLRKSSNNTAPTKAYKIPYGDWFEYVSGPHYFAEILIYMSFVMVQKGANIYTWFLLCFVIQNLSVAASNTHCWYREKFKEYPQARCRLVPFVF